MAEKQLSKRALEIAEILSIMRTEGGRNFMYRILNMTGIDADMYSPDTHEHAKNAGLRQAGLWLRNELMEATPGEYLLMMKEKLNVQRTSGSTSNNDDDTDS